MAEEYDYVSPYDYVGNNPIRRVDPDGRGWWDKVVGATVAVVDNASGGLVNLRGAYHPSSAEDARDYNQRQDAGDVLSIVAGASETATGASMTARRNRRIGC